MIASNDSVIASIFIILTLLCPQGLSAETYVGRVSPAQAFRVVSNPAPMTLADCYRLALKQSEIIAADYQKIVETEGRLLQALSIALPSVSFISQYSQEDAQKNGIITPSSASAVSTSQLYPCKDTTSRFNLKQTLFSGFKAFAAMKGVKYEKDQRVKEVARAEQLLLIDVSNAFYLLEEKREDIKALIGIKASLSSRIKELRDRDQLGRSRPSEVVSAKTGVYAVDAEIEVARSQEITTRQILEFLTGVPVGGLLCTEDSCLPQEVKAENYYLTKSLTRADVIAALDEWQVAVRTHQVVDSDFLPEVTLEGNWYTERTDISKSVDWDGFIKVSVPIFEGTDTLGRSKEARAKAKAKEYMYRRALRAAPQDVRDAYVKLITAVSVQKTLRKAYTTAKLSYHLQKRDYNLSLVSNLEVLDAIKTLHNSERDYIHSLYEARRLYWQLQVACGETLNIDGEY